MRRLGREVSEYWRTLNAHEKRRHLMHVACLMWLGSSFAHEWHELGQADFAFLAMTVVSELETFVRGQVG